MVELSPYIEIYQPVPGRYVAYDYLSRQAFPVNTPNRSKIAEAMSKSDLAEQLRERCVLVDDRIGALDDYVKRFEYKNTQQLLVDGIIHLTTTAIFDAHTAIRLKFGTIRAYLTSTYAAYSVSWKSGADWTILEASKNS